MISDWVIWRRRDENKEADELANVAMDRQSSLYYVARKLESKIKLENVALQAWSDGGHRHCGCSAAAAVVKAWHKHWDRPMVLVAVAKYVTDAACDSTSAEVQALELAAKLTHAIVNQERLTRAIVEQLLGEPTATKVELDLHPSQ
eukprot:6219471-Karenia_brevis.AAC.1